MYKYDKKIFDNGLKVAAHRMPNMKSAALGVWIKTGGRYETAANRGISHFVEHLLFKGTAKRTTSDIKNSIEGIGGILNGFTSEEMTCYLVKIVGRHLALALEVLGDMVLNARFAPRDVETERFVVLEEIKMYRDHPDQYVGELLSELLWPDGPLGIPLIGTRDIIDSLSREDIMAYKEKSYVSSNINVVACGDLDWPSLLDNCERIFSVKKRQSPFGYKKMRISQKRPQTRIARRQTEQTHIAIGFHGLSRKDPARYAMDLLNIVLGANMSSRLFHELREKRGLAYAISSHPTYYADGGTEVIDAGIDNRKISEAIGLILKELSRIKKGRITKKEFERAREYYQGILSFTFEDTLEHMLWLGKKIVTGDRRLEAEKILKEMRAVTIDDILHLAGRIFKKENLNIAVIGPAGDKDKKAIDEMAEGL